MGKKFKILHLGPEDKGTTSQRINALKELGHKLNSIHYIKIKDQPSYINDQKINYKKVKRFIFRKIGYPVEHNNENELLIGESINLKPDLIFIEKGLTIKKRKISLLQKIQRILIKKAFLSQKS